MSWLLVDVVLGILSLTALGLVGLSLYRHGRALARTVGASATVLAGASPDLHGVQTDAARRR